MSIRVKDRVAHFTGLTTCGSIWACPVCGAKIRATRAEDIARAVLVHVERGGSGYMVSLTTAHDRGDELARLFEAMATGFRKRVINGMPWKREKELAGVTGLIRTMEVTHGVNGWHPHLHVLVLVDEPIDAATLVRLAEGWYSRWCSMLVEAGYRPPSRTHGVRWDLITTAEGAAEYIAKAQDGRHVGSELARSDLKRGRWESRTPMEILDEFRRWGDMADLELWHEWEKASFRRRAITWTRGLRALLLGDDQEQTDEEVAAAEVGGEDVALLPGDQWAEVVKVPGLPAAMLEAVERGGFPELVALLLKYRLEAIRVDDGERSG